MEGMDSLLLRRPRLTCSSVGNRCKQSEGEHCFMTPTTLVVMIENQKVFKLLVSQKTNVAFGPLLPPVVGLGNSVKPKEIILRSKKVRKHTNNCGVPSEQPIRTSVSKHLDPRASVGPKFERAGGCGADRWGVLHLSGASELK